MLRSLLTLTQTLKPIPAERYLVMKLFYYDERVPEGYQPPFFMEASPDESALSFAVPALSMKVGEVGTQYHCMRMRLRTITDRLAEDPNLLQNIHSTTATANQAESEGVVPFVGQDSEHNVPLGAAHWNSSPELSETTSSQCLSDIDMEEQAGETDQIQQAHDMEKGNEQVPAQEQEEEQEQEPSIQRPSHPEPRLTEQDHQPEGAPLPTAAEQLRIPLTQLTLAEAARPISALHHQLGDESGDPSQVHEQTPGIADEEEEEKEKEKGRETDQEQEQEQEKQRQSQQEKAKSRKAVASNSAAMASPPLDMRRSASVSTVLSDTDMEKKAKSIYGEVLAYHMQQPFLLTAKTMMNKWKLTQRVATAIRQKIIAEGYASLSEEKGKGKGRYVMHPHQRTEKMEITTTITSNHKQSPLPQLCVSPKRKPSTPPPTESSLPHASQDSLFPWQPETVGGKRRKISVVEKSLNISTHPPTTTHLLPTTHQDAATTISHPRENGTNHSQQRKGQLAALVA
jgi:hypothetical protein